MLLPQIVRIRVIENRELVSKWRECKQSARPVAYDVSGMHFGSRKRGRSLREREKGSRGGQRNRASDCITLCSRTFANMESPSQFKPANSSTDLPSHSQRGYNHLPVNLPTFRIIRPIFIFTILRFTPFFNHFPRDIFFLFIWRKSE